nr:MAG TPA: hypothetical protein [Caudoviricetes sp.]
MGLVMRFLYSRQYFVYRMERNDKKTKRRMEKQNQAEEKYF